MQPVVRAPLKRRGRAEAIAAAEAARAAAATAAPSPVSATAAPIHAHAPAPRLQLAPVATTITPGTGERAIVVARYREDIEWLRPFAADCVVYNKCPQDAGVALLPGCAAQITLPNVGREAHTYITYIITHWRTMPPRLVFIQGRISDHPNGSTPAMQNRLFNNHADASPGGEPLPREFWEDRRIPEWPLGCPLAPADMPLGPWWRAHVSPTIVPSYIVWYGAIFAASRRRVRSVPLRVWKRLLDTVSHDNAPEAAHFLERAWHSLMTQFPLRTDADADAGMGA